MKVDLSDLKAVVCGGSDGIGEACSKILASNGASVIIIARNKDKLKNAVNSTLFDKLKSSEEKNGFSEAITSKKSNKKIPFFYLGPKNDWRKILDDELKNKLNDIYKQNLIELSYN